LDYPKLWCAQIAANPDFRIGHARIAGITAEKKLLNKKHRKQKSPNVVSMRQRIESVLCHIDINT
jgi:hypothetical protein